MYLNKALVLGNLSRDPELKSLPSGINVCSFAVATNRSWKNKDGSKQESVDFHNIVVFGKQAESCSQYLKKGSSALVEGRIQTRKWEADGRTNYRTEIVADRVQFGFGKSREEAGSEKKEKDLSEEKTIEYPEEEINPEDIPF